MIEGGWKKRSDSVENQPILHEARHLVLPTEGPVDRSLLSPSEEPIDRNGVAAPDYDDDDEIMELIRSELERFISERNVGATISGEEDNFPTLPNPATEQSPLYGVFSHNANEDIAKDTHEEIRNYELDDFRQVESGAAAFNQLEHNGVLRERSDSRLANRLFPGPAYTQHDRGNYLEPQPRPDKLLELIPQDQRDKYPVEVEEISYEEYLALSKKGDTFEEPIYEDTDQDITHFDHFDDNIGFDSNNDVVKIKYEDSLLTRPRMSRRNDVETVPNFRELDPNNVHLQYPQLMIPQARTLLLEPSVSSEDFIGPQLPFNHQGKVLEIPSGLFTVSDQLEDGENKLSNRRMDVGLEDYEYVDDTENTVEVPDIIEPIDEETDNESNNTIKDDSNTFVENEEEDNNNAVGEEDHDHYDQLSTSEPVSSPTTASAQPPRPVYVVYPNKDQTVLTTPSSSSTTTASTKMFDIDYDQFS